jgi:hypothetical protein
MLDQLIHRVDNLVDKDNLMLLDQLMHRVDNLVDKDNLMLFDHLMHVDHLMKKIVDFLDIEAIYINL